jgi:uncharacterized repeat protein (TIGR01451 family)
LTATISPSATGSVGNTASVAPPGGVSDLNATNNSVTDTDVVFTPADLAITKTDAEATASPGEVRTYTIVASNAGPNAASGATVTDTVPLALTGASWTCAGSGGGTCTASGTGSINDTVDLPVGASVTYLLTGTVAPNPQSLRNTATVDPPAGLTDPNTADNVATDDDLLVCLGETVIVPDGRVTEGSIAGGATRWFGARLTIYNSYSIEFKSTTGGPPPWTLTVFKGNDGCTGSSTVTTHDTSDADPPGSTRLSFEATGNESFFRARLVNGSASPIPVSYSLSDTTMYSAAWSTNGSFDTFYSFQNTTNTTLHGLLSFFITTGGLEGIIPITLPPGQTVSTNTVALARTRNLTGTVKLIHDGPPGGVLAEAAIANFSLSPAYVQPVRFQAVREAK